MPVIGKLRLKLGDLKRASSNARIDLAILITDKKMNKRDIFTLQNRYNYVENISML